jgi:hypothetical protein
MGSSLFQGWSQDSEKAGSKIRGNWIVSESVEDLIMAYNVQRFRKPCGSRSAPINALLFLYTPQKELSDFDPLI